MLKHTQDISARYVFSCKHGQSLTWHFSLRNWCSGLKMHWYGNMISVGSSEQLVKPAQIQTNQSSLQNRQVVWVRWDNDNGVAKVLSFQDWHKLCDTDKHICHTLIRGAICVRRWTQIWRHCISCIHLKKGAHNIQKKTWYKGSTICCHHHHFILSSYQTMLFISRQMIGDNDQGYFMWIE